MTIDGSPKRTKIENNRGSTSSYESQEETSIDESQQSSSCKNVRVVTRIRPLSSAEISRGCVSSMQITPASETKTEQGDTQNTPSTEHLIVDSNSRTGGMSNNINNGPNNSEKNSKRSFEFEAVFGPEATHEDVYVRSGASHSIRNDIIKGFNVTILAYGQTGSGKTFTMGTCADGPTASEKDGYVNENQGIIPRAVNDLFEITASSLDKKEPACIQLSFMEIYNEEIRDLLKEDSSGPDSSGPNSLSVRDKSDGSVCVVGLKKHIVSSPQDVQKLMALASSKRATASTAMNAVSSRSHAICTLHLTMNPTNPDSNDGCREKLTAKLTLVDLAGSERIKRTGAEGARMQEGININKGLFVLGQVVSALSDSQTSSHVPYRDSKLTRLLQDSLGGNSCTIMVACVSPASDNIEESTNSLRYAERARNIKNSAVRNVVALPLSVEEATALRKENQLLKLQLAQARAEMVGKCNRKTGRNNYGEVSINCGEVSINETDELQLENMDLVFRLKTKCFSQEQKILMLQEQIQKYLKDIMLVSKNADKWQNKFKLALHIIEEAGLKYSDANEDGSSNNQEICRLKMALTDAHTEVNIARATAAAVISAKGDVENIEYDHTNDVEVDEKKDDPVELTSELTQINSLIEEKEELSENANKEFKCILAMQEHFQSSYDKILEEKSKLQEEKQMLETRVKNISEKDQTAKHKHKDVSVGSVKMKDRVKYLEERIKALQNKASEHKRVLRMRDEAQKKYEKISNELRDDKKRKVSLQRKITELSSERRSEKLVARRNAAKILREGNRLKLEIEKVKRESEKQVAFLKRKNDEVKKKLDREKTYQNKRKHASMQKSTQQIAFKKQDEISDWINQELSTSLIVLTSKDKLEHQNYLRSTATKSLNVLKKDKTSDAEATKELVKEIEMRSGVIHQLETYKGVASNDNLYDQVKWQSHSRSEQKFIYVTVFEKLVRLKMEISLLEEGQKKKMATAQSKAVFNYQQEANETLKKLKIQHSRDMMAILETTQGAMEHKAEKIALEAVSGGVDTSVKSAIDDMLKSYFSECKHASDGVRNDLKEIRTEQNGMKQVAESMLMKEQIIKSSKPKAKAKVKTTYQYESSTDDDSEIEEESHDIDEDSDWCPTPTKRRKVKEGQILPPTPNKGRKVKEDQILPNENKSKKRKSDVFDPLDVLSEDKIQEGVKKIKCEEQNFSEEYCNSLRVADLREILRKMGLAVSGRKIELVRRILKKQSQVAEDEEKESVSQKTEESNEKENVQIEQTPPIANSTIRDNSYWKHTILKNHNNNQNIVNNLSGKRRDSLMKKQKIRKNVVTLSVTETLKDLDQTMANLG